MGLILFADTETCGFPNDRLPDEHEAQPPMVQVACILADEDNGAEWATFEAVVKPNGWTVPDSAAKIHGITTRVAELVGIPLSVVVPMYVHLRNKAAKLVFHNAEFDLKILRQAIARNGKPVSLRGPDAWECTMQMATPIMKLPPTERMVRAGRGGQFKNPNLMEAHEHFIGERFEGAHGALADVRACMRVYFAMKKLETANSAEAEQGVIANGT